jgi:3-hydroxybutyryl-CoA dehydrogenase
VTTVGVVGVGTMGTGIAQVIVAAGDTVLLHDVDAAAVEAARVAIVDRLGGDADAGIRLRVATTLDAIGAEADIVIEAAWEDLALKRTIVATLDAAAPPEVIVATNTSALSVAAIAAAAGQPERVLGLHWFNPVPRMQLVEVVHHAATDPARADRAAGLVAGWGKTPVHCRDTPGFIVNRVNRPFTIEALRLLEDGSATIVDMDATLRAAGFPMGPFELMDLIGIDVNLAAATAVWAGLGHPERLRPSLIQERLVAEGRLGRKTGEGFYRYRDGRPSGPGVGFEAVTGTRSLTAADIVERVVAAIDREARSAVADGVATPGEIDVALRLGAGHPVGPFQRAASPTA